MCICIKQYWLLFLLLFFNVPNAYELKDPVQPMYNILPLNYILESGLGVEWVKSEKGQEWIKSDTRKQWLIKSKLLAELVDSDFWNTFILDFMKHLDKNQGWRHTSELDHFLNTRIGYKWLVTKLGVKWLKSDNGKRWLLNNKRLYIFNPNFINLFNISFFVEFAISEAGQKLMLEIIEHVDTDQNWIYSSELDQLLSTTAGRSWRNTEEGQSWLESEAGIHWLCNIHSSIIATNTYNWLNTGEAIEYSITTKGQENIKNMVDRLSTIDGWIYSSELEQFLLTPTGQNWLISEEGQNWLYTYYEKEYLPTNLCIAGSCKHSKTDQWQLKVRKKVEELSTIDGWIYSSGLNKFLSSNIGLEWLDTKVGHDWLSSEMAKQWLPKANYHNWLDSEVAVKYASTERGEETMNKALNKLNVIDGFLRNSELKQFLSTKAAKEWLNTETGRKWYSNNCHNDECLDTHEDTHEYYQHLKTIANYCIEYSSEITPVLKRGVVALLF